MPGSDWSLRCARNTSRPKGITVYIVIIALLGCTAVAAAVAARIAFRLALDDGASVPIAWGAAGAAIVATNVDVCTIAAVLDVAHGQPDAPRIVATVASVVVALAAAFFGYDVTGPTAAPAGAIVATGLSRPKRLAAAASAFTGTFVILAALTPLLF